MGEERPTMRQAWSGLLVDAGRAVRVAGVRFIGAALLFQVIILLVVGPLLGWLFREALRAGGANALDLGAFQLGGGLTVTVTLLVVICILAFWVAAVQLTVLIVALQRTRRGESSSIRDLLHDLGRVGRKLLRPSSIPLFGYLFLLLPLSGFGFATVLAQGVAIPPFITGELLKSTGGVIALIALLVLLVVLNIRYALTLPVFVLTDATGGRSMRLSRRLTRGLGGVPIVATVLTVLIAATLATLVLVGVALLPALLADAAAPTAAPVVSAFSLGAAQVLGLILTAAVTEFIAAVLVCSLDRSAGQLPKDVALVERGLSREPRLPERRLGLTIAAALTVTALLLGFAAVPTMRGLARQPASLIIGHRGFAAGGVENTLCGLEAAADAGADLVEMDVMQTRDGGFVAMHDADLTRLAGLNSQVKDLTLAELTAITVNAVGYECEIPSFADYVTRASELGMPLLIEIKLGGADTPDLVIRLIDELESLDALDRNIYHSLDAASVAELKRARPDLTVGYTMAFAAVDVPDTPADFVVIEEWSATQGMQDAAHRAGLGFMTWTVNNDQALREHLRRDVDGIITDHPDKAVTLRTEMAAETGMAGVLVDALTRFVVVF